jgi:hypothetical protein
VRKKIAAKLTFQPEYFLNVVNLFNISRYVPKSESIALAGTKKRTIKELN